MCKKIACPQREKYWILPEIWLNFDISPSNIISFMIIHSNGFVNNMDLEQELIESLNRICIFHFSILDWSYPYVNIAFAMICVFAVSKENGKSIFCIVILLADICAHIDFQFQSLCCMVGKNWLSHCYFILTRSKYEIDRYVCFVKVHRISLHCLWRRMNRFFYRGRYSTEL